MINCFRNIAFENVFTKHKKRILYVILLIAPLLTQAQSHKTSGIPGDSLRADTIYIPKGIIILSTSTFIIVPRDTFMLVRSLSITKDEIKQMKQAEDFYDSVYRKFSRHRITRLLYPLAFTKPRYPAVIDAIQNIRSELPYVQYQGKIIRKINVTTLDPFGASLYDTITDAKTALGKTLNNIHLRTKRFVIRKNLLFRQGDRVDPTVLADNERILRQLPAINDVRLVCTPVPSAEDSVDITVITEDVWSLGIGLIKATPNSLACRLYDGNFLGLGDRFSNVLSIQDNTSPFLFYNEGSYMVVNIGGSFIDGMVKFQEDYNGSHTFGISFDRKFVANTTKWAGNSLFEYKKDVYDPIGVKPITSYLQVANLWLGRAFLLKKPGEPSRIVLSAGCNTRHYDSRPFISLDSNRRYYNVIQYFGSLALSKNNYYLTDYVQELGKTENIPYGHILQLTTGPEFTDFYNRLYAGFSAGAGDFIRNFGYLSGEIKVGGYFYHHGIEDGVLKLHGSYMSYLYYTPDRKYKFRSYLTLDYNRGFNFKLNNLDYSDINTNLHYPKTNDIKSLQGIESVTGHFTTVMFTPWYFYGFKFALMTQLQGGLVSSSNNNLFKSRFYSGIRTGIMIKNDNLIFPALILSLYFYPVSPEGSPWFYYGVDVNTGIQLQDFNVSSPHSESLQTN